MARKSKVSKKPAARVSRKVSPLLPSSRNGYLGLIFITFFVLGEYESYLEYGPYISFLEAFWVCSFGMVLASLGCVLGRPSFVATAMISVSTGHTVWMLDSFTLLFNGAREGSLGIADYGGIKGVTVISFLAGEWRGARSEG